MTASFKSLQIPRLFILLFYPVRYKLLAASKTKQSNKKTNIWGCLEDGSSRFFWNVGTHISLSHKTVVWIMFVYYIWDFITVQYLSEPHILHTP